MARINSESGLQNLLGLQSSRRTFPLHAYVFTKGISSIGTVNIDYKSLTFNEGILSFTNTQLSSPSEFTLKLADRLRMKKKVSTSNCAYDGTYDKSSGIYDKVGQADYGAPANYSGYYADLTRHSMGINRARFGQLESVVSSLNLTNKSDDEVVKLLADNPIIVDRQRFNDFVFNWRTKFKNQLGKLVNDVVCKYLPFYVDVKGEQYIASAGVNINPIINILNWPNTIENRKRLSGLPATITLNGLSFLVYTADVKAGNQCYSHVMDVSGGIQEKLLKYRSDIEFSFDLNHLKT